MTPLIGFLILTQILTLVSLFFTQKGMGYQLIPYHKSVVLRHGPRRPPACGTREEEE